MITHVNEQLMKFENYFLSKFALPWQKSWIRPWSIDNNNTFLNVGYQVHPDTVPWNPKSTWNK